MIMIIRILISAYRTGAMGIAALVEGKAPSYVGIMAIYCKFTLRSYDSIMHVFASRCLAVLFAFALITGTSFRAEAQSTMPMSGHECCDDMTMNGSDHHADKSQHKGEFTVLLCRYRLYGHGQFCRLPR